VEKTLKTIEFDKVLEILSKFAISALGKKRCLETQLSTDIETIKQNQRLTTQAQNSYRLAASTIPVENLVDITEILTILKGQITLSIEDIKNIYQTIIPHLPEAVMMVQQCYKYKLY